MIIHLLVDVATRLCDRRHSCRHIQGICNERTTKLDGKGTRQVARIIFRQAPRLTLCLSAAVLGAAFILVGRVASPAAAPAASSAPGPLAWWSLNEGAGSAVHDVTGHGYDGVIHGAARWGEGPSGRALYFDGSSYVEVAFAQTSRLEGPVTIQASICPADDKPNTYKPILELPDGYLLRLDNPPEGGKLSFFAFLDGDPEPRVQAGVPEPSKWHQVVAVWDKASLHLWLDGRSADRARTGTLTLKHRQLRIGEGFIGAIAEVKIYDRALSQDEILELFPPKLSLSLKAPRPVFELGSPFAVTCEVADTGGRPLPGGTVELELPQGLVLLAGEPTARLQAVLRNRPASLEWKLLGKDALASEIKVRALFSDLEPVSKSAKVVLARPIPMDGAAFDGPGLTRTGGTLVLGNRHLRLVFPTNDFGYGVFAVDVCQSNRWTRMAVSGDLSYLVVKKGAELSHRFIYADHFKPADLGPGACGLEFTRSLDDGTGTRWDCRFSFVLSNDDRVKVVYQATPDKDGSLAHFQGPTLHVGEGAFGASKDDGLFCGLEWLAGEEASSSNLDMHDPDYYVRFVPHPNKITVPLMAFSKSNAALALYWDCLQKWDGTNDRPAAVFASPNFIEGQENHLMGLFLPSVPAWVSSNTLDAAAAPYPFRAQVPLRLEAWIAAVTPARQSLACLPRWFETFGVPDPAPIPRGSYLKEIEFSARAFLESLWVENERQWWTSKGAGDLLSPKARPPHFAFQLRMAALMTQDDALRRTCNDRAALAENLGGFSPQWDDLGFTWADPAPRLAALGHAAIERLDSMEPDGSWRFRTRVETTGVFKGMDYSLLGPDRAAEVGTCALNLYEVLRFARLAGDADVFKAAEKPLAFIEQFAVPRAAQVWECPVHSPDILAAADAIDAELEAYRCSGNQHYLEEARRWAWTGLPFVYVWNPPGKPILRYASIPIFGASWFAGSWIGQPVQWNGLRYAYALLKLADYDHSFPWRRVAEGLTISALYQQDTDGPNAALWPDNFSALDWSKCPWLFEPGLIAKNIYKILGRDMEPATTTVGTGNNRFFITTRARVSQAAWRDNLLSFQAQFPEGEGGCVVAAGLERPLRVLLDGSSLAQSRTDGWQYVDGQGFLVIRLPASGPHLLEISGARHRAGSLFPSRLSVIAFDFANGLQGWTPASQVEDLRVEGGLLKGLATGSNSYLHRTRLRVDGRLDQKLSVRSRSATGASIGLYWITQDSPDWAEDKSIHLPFKRGPDFSEYVFDVGRHPLWAGKTIIGLRLDPMDGDTGGEFAVQSITD
ncbi:MAG: LamG domain-containing protein [Verrucomicrobiota bacterium]